MWQPWAQENAEETDDQQILEEDMAEEISYRNGRLSLETKHIVVNVYNGLLEIMPKKEAVKRTIQLTKVSRATFYRILKEGPRPAKARLDKGAFRKLKISDLPLIIKTVSKMLSDNISPTVPLLLEYLKKESINCSHYTLRRYLKSVLKMLRK